MTLIPLAELKSYLIPHVLKREMKRVCVYFLRNSIDAMRLLPDLLSSHYSVSFLGIEKVLKCLK